MAFFNSQLNYANPLVFALVVDQCWNPPSFVFPSGRRAAVALGRPIILSDTDFSYSSTVELNLLQGELDIVQSEVKKQLITTTHQRRSLVDQQFEFEAT